MKHLILCDATNPQDIVELCRQYDCGIEVQAFFSPNALADPTLPEQTAELISGISPISMHAPFGDLNPGSFDHLVRDITRQRIQAGYDIGLRLNAKHIICHHGFVPNTSPEPNWINRSVEFWTDFLEQIPADVHIYLENMLEPTPQILCGILEQVDHPNLHANLDIGHAHCNSTTPVLDWIAELSANIGYVHLHDNHGENDEHLGLGQGTIPMLDVCQALNKYAPDAIWAIEAEGEGILQSLDWLNDNKVL